MARDVTRFVVEVAIALALVAAGLLWLTHVQGCTFARVRYVDGAATSAELACTVRASDFVCRDYYQALRMDGVQLVPARAPRDLHNL